MKISPMDRGLYFRGLLLLVRQDREVGKGERDLVMRLGRCFSFDRDFCQGALDEVLTNPHLAGEALVFADPVVAGCFVRDGLRLSRADGRIHPRELRWLRAIATGNGLDWSPYEAAVRVPAGQSVPATGPVLEAEGFECD